MVYVRLVPLPGKVLTLSISTHYVVTSSSYCIYLLRALCELFDGRVGCVSVGIQIPNFTV